MDGYRGGMGYREGVGDIVGAALRCGGWKNYDLLLSDAYLPPLDYHGMRNT